jgi:hypothetical protein
MNKAKAMVLNNATKSTKVINSSKKGLSISKPLETEKIQKPIKAKIEKPTLLLAEGITSKQLLKAKYESNAKMKAEFKSPSKAYQFYLEFFKAHYEKIQGFNANDVKPSIEFNDKYRTEYEKNFGFSAYRWSLMVERFYKK